MSEKHEADGRVVSVEWECNLCKNRFLTKEARDQHRMLEQSEIEAEKRRESHHVNFGEPMTVGKLVDLLSTYPRQMLVTTELYSDFRYLGEPKVIMVVKHPTYLERFEGDQYDAERYKAQYKEKPPARRLVEVLYFEGN